MDLAIIEAVLAVCFAIMQRYFDGTELDRSVHVNYASVAFKYLTLITVVMAVLQLSGEFPTQIALQVLFAFALVILLLVLFLDAVALMPYIVQVMTRRLKG